MIPPLRKINCGVVMIMLPASPSPEVSVNKPLDDSETVEAPLISIASEACTEISPASPSPRVLAKTIPPSCKTKREVAIAIFPPFPVPKVDANKLLCNPVTVETPLISTASDACTEIFPALPSC